MNTKIMALAVSALSALAAGITVCAEGGDAVNVAKVGGTEYATLDAALNAVLDGGTDGGTIELIADIKDMGTFYVGGTDIVIDGQDHTISGNSNLYLTNGCGLTIENVNFKDIEDPGKTKLSSIYAPGFRGSLTIKNCDFTDVEYETLQSTPEDGASFVIENNTYSIEDASDPQRFIHIESREFGTYANNDISAAINNNKFNSIDKLNSGAVEVYGYADEDKINAGYNYYDGSALMYGTVSQYIDGNAWENHSIKMYPRYTTADMDEQYTPAVIRLADFGIEDEYEAIAAAIADDAGAVVLASDLTEDVVIPEGKSLSIDLNGHKITNVSGHTITNCGSLTVTGEGTVDNVTHAKAAVYNAPGATAELKGGTYDRSLENGSQSGNGGNSYYYIQNQGTMTLGNVKVSSSGSYSSLIENGWQNGKDNTAGADAVMTINGGSYSGGLNTVKNDDYGVLTINDGTFSNDVQHAVMNWNVANINGGSFTSGKAENITTGHINDTMDKGILNITGGDFSTGIRITTPAEGASDTEISKEGVTVSGGTFKGDITEYLADGAAYSTADGKYSVYSADSMISEEGTYMMPGEDGMYDQLTMMQKEISGTVNVSDMSFTIKDGDTESKYQYKGNTTFTDASVLFGLVVTDIPEGTAVTVTMD